MLTEWREQGDQLIVCLDANEDIYKKSLGKALTAWDGLAMKEVVGGFTGRRLGPTHFRGSKLIDGIWATSNVTISSACVMPVGFGTGDHRLFVIDVQVSLIIGTDPIRVVRPQARCLNTKIPQALEQYNEKLEDLVSWHRLVERSGKAYELDCPLASESALNKIDSELKDYMLSAKKSCRKIKSGRIPFSPEAELWIRRVQFYKTLVRFWDGYQCNYGNLWRSARKLGIQNPMELTDNDVALRLQVCKE